MTGCVRADEGGQAAPVRMMSPSIATRENRLFASELKFVVPRATALQIREWARSHLAADGYGGGPARDQYRITSIYFDTAAFDVFHRNGSFGRGKYRIRRYGSGEVVFLERKLRTKACLTKRRTSVPIGDLALLRTGIAPDEWPGKWFARRLAARQIRPVCQVSYERTARVAMTQVGPVRLTVDDDLRAQVALGAQFQAPPGVPVLPEHSIVEMKFTVSMPVIFKLIAEEFALNPVRFSKYRCAAGELELADEAVAGSAPENEEARGGSGSHA